VLTLRVMNSVLVIIVFILGALGSFMHFLLEGNHLKTIALNALNMYIQKNKLNSYEITNRVNIENITNDNLIICNKTCLKNNNEDSLIAIIAIGCICTNSYEYSYDKYPYDIYIFLQNN